LHLLEDNFSFVSFEVLTLVFGLELANLRRRLQVVRLLLLAQPHEKFGFPVAKLWPCLPRFENSRNILYLSVVAFPLNELLFLDLTDFLEEIADREHAVFLS
jgi:hypothetical protein